MLQKYANLKLRYNSRQTVYYFPYKKWTTAQSRMIVQDTYTKIISGDYSVENQKTPRKKKYFVTQAGIELNFQFVYICALLRF